MSKPVLISIPVHVPPSLHRRLLAAAAEFGIPLENYIAGVLVDAVVPAGFITEEPGDFADD
jgi:predicted HicB family RNase H-like nuclease